MKSNLNLLIAAIFMVGFLMFWDSFVMSRYRSKPLHPSTNPSATDVQQKMPEEAPASSPVAVGTEDKLTVLEADDVKVSMLSRGARVASWQIKERDHWIELVEPEDHRTTSPLETFPDLNFSIDKKSPAEAVFTAVRADGVKVTKTLKLLAQPPFHELTIALSNPNKADVSVSYDIMFGNGVDKHVVGEPYNKGAENAVAAETRALGYAKLVKSWKPGLIFGRMVDTVDAGPFEWVGVDNNHFMTVMISNNKDIARVHATADRKTPPVLAVPLSVTLKPGEMNSTSYQLYFGPKNYTELRKFGHHLDEAVNFGFFGPIAKVLLLALKGLKNLTGNFGWAIVLMTVLIQVLILPLTKKNLQHAARMKELQPQLKKIQEQFKSDPKRLQAETFNLYKKNGMKFMGMEGCFPMLLQMPVLFAFYAMLRVAYDLRGAPWIFWIHDLGSYDPYYVLPILMGVGVFLQQKLTSVTVDPSQARMMMFMPVMLTIMFRTLPAGFTLYMCVSSLTTITIQRLLGVHKQQNPQPAT